MPIRCEKCNEMVDALPIHRCSIKPETTLRESLEALVREWRDNAEGLAEAAEAEDEILNNDYVVGQMRGDSNRCNHVADQLEATIAIIKREKGDE